MKKSRFTEQQIAFALRQAEGGASVREVCRKLGASEQTYYRWKKKFAGMGVAEVSHESGARRGCMTSTRVF